MSVTPTLDMLIPIFKIRLFLVAQNENDCLVKLILYLYFYLCFLSSVIFPLSSSTSDINNGMTHYHPACIIRELPPPAALTAITRILHLDIRTVVEELR